MMSFIFGLFQRNSGYSPLERLAQKKDDDYPETICSLIEDLFAENLPSEATDLNMVEYSKKMKELGYRIREYPLEDISDIRPIVKKISSFIKVTMHYWNLRTGLDEAIQASRSSRRKNALEALRLSLPYSSSFPKTFVELRERQIASTRRKAEKKPLFHKN